MAGYDRAELIWTYELNSKVANVPHFSAQTPTAKKKFAQQPMLRYLNGHLIYQIKFNGLSRVGAARKLFRPTGGEN